MNCVKRCKIRIIGVLIEPISFYLCAFCIDLCYKYRRDVRKGLFFVVFLEDRKNIEILHIAILLYHSRFKLLLLVVFDHASVAIVYTLEMAILRRNQSKNG